MQLLTLFAVLCASFNFIKCKPVERSDDGFSIRIVHTNDMHARFEETNKFSAPCTAEQSSKGQCYGGFARLATLIREAKDSSTPALFLNAGDTYQGTIWFTIYKEAIVTKMLNMLEPDAISLGNHEFDNGVDGLVPFLEKATFPIVTANLDLSNEPKLQSMKNLKNSTILNVRDEKIAVIGYLTPETKSISKSDGVIFRDEIEAIREEIARIKQENDDIKIFIALGHSGFTTDKKIAEEVEDIDLVIGGHTNTFLYNGKQPDVEVPDGLYPTAVVQESGRKVYVVQAYAYTKYLGNLSIDFDSNGEITSIVGSPILVDSSIAKAKDVQNVLDEMKAGLKEYLNVTVGTTKVHLDGDVKSCRFNECNLGNLITDALVDYNVRQAVWNDSWTNAAICLHNSGTIRASITERNNNQVSKSDVFTVLPFRNVPFLVEVTGKDILDALEFSVHTLKPDLTNDPFGGFLQVSGLQVTYDINKEPYNRVIKSKVFALCTKCEIPKYEPLKETVNYTILLPDFLYFGGDGFKMFEGKPYKTLGLNTADMLIEYFKAHSPVHPAVEGRIKFVHNEPVDDTKANNKASSLSSLTLAFLILAQIFRSSL